MFERYTEKARRVIFFARYEAAQFGRELIETEHLVLGLLREDKALARRFLQGNTIETLRPEIEQQTTLRRKVSTSITSAPNICSWVCCAKRSALALVC